MLLIFIIVLILTVNGSDHFTNLTKIKKSKYPCLHEYYIYLKTYLNKTNSLNSIVDTFPSNFKNLNSNNKMIFKKPLNNTKHHVQKIPNRVNQTVNYNILNLLKTLKQNLNKTDNSTGQLVSYLNRNRILNVQTRLLNLFTVINLNHDACSVENAYGSFNGTCYHKAECLYLGGNIVGRCLNLFAVCCVFEYSCGDRSTNTRVYFSNPDYPKPSTDRLLCMFILEKANQHVKQIRIDFDSFELLPPQNGICADDQLVITGQNINNLVPVLCGINNGQHIYLDVTDSDDPIVFSFITHFEEKRIFRLFITQLTNENLGLRPNCLQYFTELNGSFETFNYQESGLVRTSSVPGYLNNLNYVACVRKASGYCTITYTNIDEFGYEYPFELANLDEEGEMLIPPDQAGADIFNCPDDYIAINGVRMCGERLNDGAVEPDFSFNYPVTDFTGGPFVLPIRTNENVNGRGFKLFYRQNKCLN